MIPFWGTFSFIAVIVFIFRIRKTKNLKGNNKLNKIGLVISIIILSSCLILDSDDNNTEIKKKLSLRLSH